ncbi:MAG: hypothetical protein ABIK86_03455 [candidate division WOR-3 bacterium]
MPKSSLGVLPVLLLVGAVTRPIDLPEHRQIVEYTYLQQYDSAGQLIHEIASLDRKDPAAAFWLLTLLQLLIYDSGNSWLSDSFYSVCERATELASQRLRQNAHDASARFYRGMTLLTRARYQAWLGQPSMALRTMLGVVPELRKALSDDSTLVDAWLGLGMVEYFRALSSRYTLGLPVLGSRQAAREMVKKVIEGRGVFRTAARFSLAFMLKEDGDHAAAESLCRSLLRSYPGNRSALRTMRDNSFQAGNYVQAVSIGRAVDSLIRRSFPGNLYGLSENWLVTAKAWQGLAQLDSARVYADSVLAYESRAEEVPWLRTYLREARAIRGR